ncbi:Maf family nucleotide pyrophosphatase [Hyphomicrobiales bacterium]|jgi:septum formation protein|nr:septum formation protein Maf [Rhodobiaceae bacterium]MBT6222767.1 septum formation protein Maf [Rhodobiaceae bacterium]MDC0139751.1 Maf family nucleotide pyrophosphatase [Hyphomicrobiales bacterium]
MNSKLKLILASKSERRIQILNNLGIIPDVVLPANINENIKKGEKPRSLAIRLANEKATHIYQLRKNNIEDSLILSADTVVAVGTRVIEKPTSALEAYKAIKLLSGKNHKVYTCVCIIDAKGNYYKKLAETRVKFKNLSEEEIKYYIKTNDWIDKAGGYAIQGKAQSFIIKISGSYSSVVGLPAYETIHLLRGLGYDVYKS